MLARTLVVLSGPRYFGAGTPAGLLLGKRERSGIAAAFTAQTPDLLIRDPATTLNYSGAPSGKLSMVRASTHSYFDAAGEMQLASNNVFAYDYDPVTLAAKGLHCWGAATNLLLNSTIDGVALATQNVTVTAQAYTLSFYGTGSVTLTDASTAGPLVGTGVKARVSLTFTPSAGTLTLTVAGDVKWAQLETGVFASPWIPTTGSTAARGLFVLTMALSLIPFNATEGSVRIRARRGTVVAAGYMMQIDDGTNANRVAALFAASPSGQFLIQAASATQASVLPGVPVAGQAHEFLGLWAATDVRASLDGVSGTPDTLATIPAMTTMRIGGGLSGTAPVNGWIESFVYLPHR